MTAWSRGCRVAALCLAGTVIVGCAQDEPAAQSPTPEPTGTPVVACSAAGMDISMFTENPDLTGPANETRRTIAADGVACDYEGLAELARGDFSYSFGDAGQPSTFWRAREADGEPVLRYLVTLLRLDTFVEEAGPGEDPMRGTLYTWPRAYKSDERRTRVELEEAFGAQTVESWFAPEGYVGWRVGIRGDGSWAFYVAGD